MPILWKPLNPNLDTLHAFDLPLHLNNHELISLCRKGTVIPRTPNNTPNGKKCKTCLLKVKKTKHTAGGLDF